MILSSSVLTLSAIGTNALSNTRLHRHYETAATLIDRQLSLIDHLGIDAFLEAGQTDGVIEEYDPGYHWSVTTEYQGVDDLYLVSITMTWLEGSRPYSVVTETLLDGATAGAATTDLTTTTGTETGGQQTP